MGFTFTNVQLRKAEKYDKALADSIASSVASSRGWKRVDNPDEADVTTVIASSETSPWIAVVSDAFDGDLDAAIHAAQGLSEYLQTDALVIGCFDSDYLFLNMLNPSDGIDLWASCGSAAVAGLSGMRRSNFRAWSRRVKDIDAFRNIMKQPRDFAEDCLSDLEEILDLPVMQSTGSGEDWSGVSESYQYYYVVAEEVESGDPPVLEWHLPPAYAPSEGQENIISAINRGGASRGLAIAFMGEDVEKSKVAVYTATVQVRDRRGEWALYPLEIQEKEDAIGQKMLYGELPSLPIPEKVSERLPWKKRMEREYQRSIALRYVPESLHPYHEGSRLTGLTVHMIPLKNWQGQCGWRGRPMEKEF